MPANSQAVRTCSLVIFILDEVRYTHVATGPARFSDKQQQGCHHIAFWDQPHAKCT